MRKALSFNRWILLLVAGWIFRAEKFIHVSSIFHWINWFVCLELIEILSDAVPFVKIELIIV